MVSLFEDLEEMRDFNSSQLLASQCGGWVIEVLVTSMVGTENEDDDTFFALIES